VPRSCPKPLPARPRIKRSTAFLVQEFVHGIDAGEQAGVFFDGVFSHGLRRTAAPGEFRINTQYGGRIEATLIGPDNEPGLGLDLAAASADPFADALLRRL